MFVKRNNRGISCTTCTFIIASRLRVYKNHCVMWFQHASCNSSISTERNSDLHLVSSFISILHFAVPYTNAGGVYQYLILKTFKMDASIKFFIILITKCNVKRFNIQKFARLYSDTQYPASIKWTPASFSKNTEVLSKFLQFPVEQYQCSHTAHTAAQVVWDC